MFSSLVYRELLGKGNRWRGEAVGRKVVLSSGLNFLALALCPSPCPSRPDLAHPPGLSFLSPRTAYFGMSTESGLSMYSCIWAGSSMSSWWYFFSKTFWAFSLRDGSRVDMTGERMLMAFLIAGRFAIILLGWGEATARLHHPVFEKGSWTLD